MEDGQRHNISRHVCSWGKLIQIALLQGAGECQGNVARGILSFRPNLVQRILQHLYRIALRTTDCLHAWVKVPKSGKGKKKAKAVNKDRHIRGSNDLVKCLNEKKYIPFPLGFNLAALLNAAKCFCVAIPWFSCSATQEGLRNHHYHRYIYVYRCHQLING